MTIDDLNNDQFKELISIMPYISENMRQCALYTLDCLDKLEVVIESVNFSGYGQFSFVLPLANEMRQVSLAFGFNEEEAISCGPSHFPANFETVDAYINMLNKFMPRRGMTIKDIIEAHNPDEIIMFTDVFG